MSRATPETDSNIVESLRNNREDKTVGYGEKYPRPTNENLVVEMSHHACAVTHPIETKQVGYKYADFTEPKNGINIFISILRSVGLHPVEDYTRVYRDMGW